MDHALCGDIHLQYLLEHGANFRPTPTDTDKDTIFTSTKAEFKKLIALGSKKFTVQVMELNMWLNCTIRYT